MSPADGLTPVVPDDAPELKPTVTGGKKAWNSSLPIPDYFYDIGFNLAPIASLRLVRFFSFCLYLVTAGVFVGTQVYYAMPAQLLSADSKVSSEWQQDGYTCRPLQDANLHGLSTAWTFDECVAKVQPPTDANIVEVEKADGSTHFDYRFATEADSSGVLSAYDTWRDTAVLQASGGDDDWKRDGGYSCWPVFPYLNTFNVRYNYTECLGAVLPATLTGGVRKLTCDWSSCCAGAGGCMIFYVYYPFGPEEKCYMNAGWPSLRDITMQERLLAHYGDNNRFGAGLVMTQYSNKQTTIDVTGQAPNQPWQAQDGCLGFQDYQNHAPGDVTVVNDWWTKAVSMPPDTYGGFDKEFICSEMKRNTNGFQCFDDSKSPPTTRDEAVKHYAAAENTPESLCAPLKQNSPFECTTPVEVALVTRINLALSAAQAIFAACGMMFVYLLRRLSSGGD